MLLATDGIKKGILIGAKSSTLSMLTADKNNF